MINESLHLRFFELKILVNLPNISANHSQTEEKDQNA